MRITNEMLARSTVSGYQRLSQRVDEARERASTGLRVQRASDDPIAAAGIMGSSSALRALEQYRRNIASARSRLDVEDTVLDQLGGALTRAKELGLSQGQDTASAQTRLQVKAEVDGLLEIMDGLANTSVAGRYLFGGQYSDRAPLAGGDPDPARPPAGGTEVEVGAGRRLATTHSAQELFVDSGAVASLRRLSDALAANDPVAVRASFPDIDSALDSVQERVGELGARMNQLDLAGSNLDALEVNLQTFRSELQDADLAQAVTELVSLQDRLQAAMSANARVLSTTLADYLR